MENNNTVFYTRRSNGVDAAVEQGMGAGVGDATREAVGPSF